MFRRIASATGAMGAARVRPNASLLLKNKPQLRSSGWGGDAVPHAHEDCLLLAYYLNQNALASSSPSASVSASALRVGRANTPASSRFGQRRAFSTAGRNVLGDGMPVTDIPSRTNTGRAGTPAAVEVPTQSEAAVHADREAPHIDELVSASKSKSDVRNWTSKAAPSGSVSSTSSGVSAAPGSEDRSSHFNQSSRTRGTGAGVSAGDRTPHRREKKLAEEARDSIADATQKAKDLFKDKATKVARAVGISSDKPKMSVSKPLSTEPTVPANASSDINAPSVASGLRPNSKVEQADLDSEVRGGLGSKPKSGSNSLQNRSAAPKGEGSNLRRMRSGARPITDVKLSKEDVREVDAAVKKVSTTRDEYIHNTSRLSGSGRTGLNNPGATPGNAPTTDRGGKAIRSPSL